MENKVNHPHNPSGKTCVLEILAVLLCSAAMVLFMDTEATATLVKASILLAVVGIAASLSIAYQVWKAR